MPRLRGLVIGRLRQIGRQGLLEPDSDSGRNKNAQEMTGSDGLVGGSAEVEIRVSDRLVSSPGGG